MICNRFIALICILLSTIAIAGDDRTLHATQVILSNGVNTTTLQAGTLSGNTSFNLPPNNGTMGYFLSSDGSGTLIWLTRTLTLTPPLQGSGDLTQNRTFSITQAATAANGYVSSTDWNTFNGKVSTTEAVNTTAPLQGGGDLSAPRTLSITQAATAANGYLSSTDWNTFNTKQNALTFGNLSASPASVLSVTGGTGAVIGAGATVTESQAGTLANGYLSSTDWNTFNSKQATVSATAPVTFSANTVGITQSGLAGNGYLSSTDWNTFNGKENAFTPGNLTEATSSVLTITGGSGSVFGAGTTVQVKQAATAQSGYLSSTDWNTFNNSAATSVPQTRLVNTTAPLQGGGDLTANRTLSITQSATAADGYLSSTDWNTFNGKQAAISASAPITFSSNIVAITQAATAANGYLSSTDWNTFNGKQPAGSYALQATAVNTTAPLSGGGDLSTTRTLSITQAATAANGYLSSTDWNTFNTKVSATRAITTTAPLSGGGDLSADRVLSITQAATAANGYLSSTDWNTFNSIAKVMTTAGDTIYGGTAGAPTRLPAGSATQVLHSGTIPSWSAVSLTADVTGVLPTGNMAGPAATGTSGYLSSTDWNTFNDRALSTRAINTTAPLQGGGDLTADRTLSITQAATAANGYLSSTDWNTFNTKQAALLTTKGDLLTHSTVDIRLGVGTDGQALTADSTQATGLKWSGVATNPMTTLGDLTYGGASGAPTRLAGTTTNSIHAVLSSTATAGVGNAPTLSQINANDFFASGAEVTQTSRGVVKSAGQLLGTNTNDTAGAGFVGENISQTRLRSAATSLTSGANANVTATKLTLTAGDWLIHAAIGFTPGATTSITQMHAAISNTSATLPANDTLFVPDSSGQVRILWDQPASVNGSDLGFTLPPTRVSLAGSTDFYLVTQATFSISTLTAYGSIAAVRIR